MECNGAIKKELQLSTSTDMERSPCHICSLQNTSVYVCECDRNMCKDTYQNIHSGYLQLKDVWEFLYIFLLFIFTMAL